MDALPGRSSGYAETILGTAAGSLVSAALLAAFPVLVRAALSPHVVYPATVALAAAFPTLGCWFSLNRHGRSGAISTSVLVYASSLVLGFSIPPLMFGFSLLPSSSADLLGFVAVVLAWSLLARLIVRLVLGRRAEKSPTESRVKIQRRLAFSALACSSILAAVLAGFLLNETIRNFNDLRDVFYSPPPPGALVCPAPVGSDCGTSAADRVGRSVAWIPSIPGYKTDGLIAVRGQRQSLAFEDFNAQSGAIEFIELSSPATEPLMDPPGDTTVTANGDVGQLTQLPGVAPDDSGSAAEIVWKHDGFHYQLGVYYLYASPSQGDAKTEILALWHQVRYSDPTASGPQSAP